MKEDHYHIVVHIVNVIVLGFICLFWLYPSVSAPEEDPNVKLLQFGLFGFMIVSWAVNYWLQYRAKKKKWYLPLAGTILYVAFLSLFLLLIFPFINSLFFS
ncbi:hypothetical protein HNO89_000201 [Sporosarcina luteola]|nr:hypothetical protein [Sporosarcina luteola]